MGSVSLLCVRKNECVFWAGMKARSNRSHLRPLRYVCFNVRGRQPRVSAHSRRKMTAHLACKGVAIRG